MSSSLITVQDFEKLTASKVPTAIYDFFAEGSVGGQTVKDNIEAFKRWRFRPRVLRDVCNIDTSIAVQGIKIPFPIGLSPTGLQGLAHEDGEIAASRAASKLGTVYTLSIWASRSMEDVSSANENSLLWCNTEFMKNRELHKHFIKRAEKNGFRALVFTVDKVVRAKRRAIHDVISQNRYGNFAETSEVFFPGKDVYLSRLSQEIHSASWSYIDWLKSITDLPVVVKGIITGEMAMEAVEHGVDGIIVSNHGGRQLDGVFATIDALPEVVKAVSGRCEVYLDGGIRSGNDVAKAVALGARAVFIGRPLLWGLACDGENGVRKVLEILRDEFVTTMKLLGVTSIKELQTTPNLVVHESRISKV